jgi:hypothetical protein
MKTKCFKLISGEEIISDVTNETSEFVGLKNPMVLAMVGEGQLAMFPWLPLAEKQEHTLLNRNIIIDYTPNVQLISGYKQKTGGIVVAPAGLLNKGILSDWENS